jgi:hypothetical protein
VKKRWLEGISLFYPFSVHSGQFSVRKKKRLKGICVFAH